MLGHVTVNEVLARSSRMASRFPMHMALAGTAGVASNGTILVKWRRGEYLQPHSSLL